MICRRVTRRGRTIRHVTACFVRYESSERACGWGKSGESTSPGLSRLCRAGIVQFMSAAGNCYDNAFMESCFGTIKTELQLVDYADHTAAVRELTEYIRYYNFERRHSALGYDTPLEYEQRLAQATPPPP